HQRGPQAAVDLSAPGAAAGSGPDVAGARAQPAGRRPARALGQGLKAAAMAEQPSHPLLEIEGLSVSFLAGEVELPAVVDFSCSIMPGEALGLVGESGCGKSTTALAVMGYLGQSGRITKGRVRFKGRDMAEMSARALRALRGSEIAMIYQEPMA